MSPFLNGLSSRMSSDAYGYARARVRKRFGAFWSYSIKR